MKKLLTILFLGIFLISMTGSNDGTNDGATRGVTGKKNKKRFQHFNPESRKKLYSVCNNRGWKNE